MRKMVWSLATVVAVFVLPQIVAAEESKRPGPPGPEMLFKLLDANHDGVISEDEIPADAPEPLKALLKAADKKRDKKVTLEEFVAAVKEHPPVMPPFGMPGGMPMPGMGGMMPMPGMPGGMMPPFCPSGPTAGVMPSHGGPLGKEPDLKALFAKMDKNNDGKLTVEEFTEGMKKIARGNDGTPASGGPDTWAGYAHAARAHARYADAPATVPDAGNDDAPTFPNARHDDATRRTGPLDDGRTDVGASRCPVSGQGTGGTLQRPGGEAEIAGGES